MKAGEESGVAQPVAAPPPAAVVGAPSEAPVVKLGELIEFTLDNGARRVGIVTAVHMASGRIGLVYFGREIGEDAVTLEPDVLYAADPTWMRRWRKLPA